MVGLLAVVLGLGLSGHWTAALHALPGTPAAARPAYPLLVPSPSSSATADPTLAAARAILAPAAAPSRLQVPAIRVDAEVEAVGQDAQGRMGTPSLASRVAWYRLGVTPGDVGNAVIAGHLDWTTGPAVFWLLGRVHKGDEVTVVRADGTQARFIVDSSGTVPYDSPTDSLFTREGPPSLTLITCAGTWDRQRGTYLQRLVVHATLAPNVTPLASGDEGG